MENLGNGTPPAQEIIYEVGYKRISNSSLASILISSAACYLYTESSTASIVAAIFSTMIFAQGAVGHAHLLTPSKKITSQSSFSGPISEGAKLYGPLSNDFKKNPRIHICLNATDSQIKIVESSRIILSTTCSHGSSRLLAKAGLPHASFPISLSPTLTAFYLEYQPSKDNSIKVKYINWAPDQSRIEIKIATFVESFLAGAALSAISFKGINNIYGLIYDYENNYLLNF